MMTDGVARYGEGAYGPSGTLIDTGSSFNVKTEFISDPGY